MTLQSTINEFLTHCQFEKNLNTKTIEAYTMDLDQFLNFVSSEDIRNDVRKIDKIILKEYLQKLSLFKTKTIKRKMACLKAMFNYLEYENDDFYSPFHRLKIRLKDAFILPTVMNIDEIRKILNMLYQSLNNIDRKKYKYKSMIRDITVIELLFATGMRVSELCQLQINDVDLKQGVIKIFGKGSKERMIQVCQQETIQALQNYINLFSEQIQSNQPFFINRLGNGLSTQSVRIMVKNYIKQSEINKRITPHTFRHTFATLLLEEDVDLKYIQTLLGHSSITTTQIYTHVNMEKQKEILLTKHPRQKIRLE
ncbi:MAG: tyrosine-type recombinase/integrase [Bacteroidales bacterium]|jgi:integrase/recombinase XerD|nr:tyrosine-type recombinase/integrase [Bacteroidales bacterium]